MLTSSASLLPPKVASQGDRSPSLRGVSLLFHDVLSVLQTLRRVPLRDTFSAVLEYIYLDETDVTDETSLGVRLLRRVLGVLVTNLRRSIVGRAALSYVLLAFWILLGACYGYYVEHYDLSSSLLYSVSSITTFGIVAPEPNIQSRWFTILFTISGFAIYLNSVGKIAGVLVEQYELEQSQQQCDEFSTTSVDAWTPSDQKAGLQTWAEFLERELLQSGLVDQDCLDDIRKEFLRRE